MESLEVSVNTIYRAVKSGRLSFEARKYLRRRGKTYKRKTRQDGRGHIKDTVSIELRPKEVEQRLDIGNWEIDTVLGKPGTGYSGPPVKDQKGVKKSLGQGSRNEALFIHAARVYLSR